jgi:arylsulfatase A-like enzyme
MKTIGVYISLLAFSVAAQSGEKSDKLNILCITCEDISQYVGCFGDKVAKTPHLDKFSKEAIRFNRMYTTMGVSAPSRAALITGMYPSSIGANNMRSYVLPSERNGKTTPIYEVVPPAGVKCFTEYLRENGYYCTNNVKTDYQFAPPLTAWDENSRQAHWKNRPEGMPFYSLFNLEVSHESRLWLRANEPLTTLPEEVILPPYYPDNAVLRRDMAVMYSNITEMDRQFGEKLKELKEAGLYDNTIIIWFSDNGGPLPNQKRSIYERGTLVPFMIRFPDGYRAGEVDDRLCMFPDIPATILSVARIKPPAKMQGRAFLGKYNTAPRNFIYGARDRLDEQVDKQGAVRDARFRYVRNYMPEKAGYLPVAYRLQIPMMRNLLELLKKDSLNEAQKKWFEAPRSAEEFYDVQNDPHELNNLIHNPAYQKDIQRLRKEYNRWMATYNENWLQTEQQNIAQFMPGGKQLQVGKPVIDMKKNTINLSCATPGASFAYQINGKAYGDSTKWYFYSRPFVVDKGTRIDVKAVRAGYQDSKVEFLIN